MYLLSLPLAILWVFACAGCGLDDSAQAACRCTAETDLNLFPHCRGAEIAAERTTSGNPFSVQTPDCPSGQLLLLLEPTRPENVLANVRIVFEARPQERSPNQYMDQLSEGFFFLPDVQDIQLHPEVYDANRDTLWTREQERRFALAVLDPQSVDAIRFHRWYEAAKDERILSEEGLLETYVFPYEIDFAELSDKGESGDIISIKGRMEVDLITPTVENPVWVIQRWQDQRDVAPAKRSWGELRAEFAH